jgi:FtsZ-binding cell division protein ZapB
MPLKKVSTLGAAALQPLDPNQETLSLREARSQKRKATSPTPQEGELDQEITNTEILHQQVQKKKAKMARLTDLQRQIDEATEEVRHLTQDEQDRRPQHRELHQEGLFNDDRWYDASPFQQNYELSRGPHHTSHLSFQCMMGIQTQSSF